MSFKVNIEQGTSLYTTDELISYGLFGCLYAGEVELTFLVERIVTHYEDKQKTYETDINDLEDDAYSRGRSELLDEIKNYLENI